MTDDNTVDNTDQPVDDVMDLFPTDHDIEETDTTDEIVEESEVEGSKTEEEENEESTEESQEETEEEVEESETVSLDDLEIKVLGEVTKLKDLPRDEVQTRLQKGSDYDRVKEKLNTMTEDSNEWGEISEMFEMTPQQVKEILREQYFNNKADSEGRNVTDVINEYNINRKSANDKMFDKFVSKYPDIKTDEIPQEVLESVKNGKDLVETYEKYASDKETNNKNSEIDSLKSEIEALKKQVGVKKQNNTTKKKGVIKKTSGSGDNGNKDDFLSGLLG